MDNRKYVVFIKNKNRTNDIESCTLMNNIYNIFFKDSKQLYLYNTNQVKYYKITNIKETEPEDIIITYDSAFKSGKIYSLVEMHSSENNEMFVSNKKSYLSHFHVSKPLSIIEDLSNKIVRCNGNIFAEIKTIYVYDNYYKIVFKAGLSKIYEKSILSISEQVNDLPVINYFKDISSNLKSYSPVYTYLSDMYNSILVDNSSIFYNYINDPKIVETKNKLDIFYPFYFTEYQTHAIENAFSYNISLIENPSRHSEKYLLF